MTTKYSDLLSYPGGDLIARGLDHLARLQPTAEAALVEVARTRLADLGLSVSGSTVGSHDAELALYERLCEGGLSGDPYGTYCAWLDQLVSFLAAFKRRDSTSA